MEQAQVTEPAESESPLSQEEKQRRIVVYALNGTLLAGLALALVYLGGRVMETRAAAKSPEVTAATQPQRAQPAAPIPAKPATLPQPARATAAPNHTVIGPVAQQATPLKKYAGAMIEPKPGERYLQMGAYGPTFTHAFVEELKGQGFQPVVAQGPSEDVYRVLIGPLNRDSMKRIQDQVEQAGISGTMPRLY